MSAGRAEIVIANALSAARGSHRYGEQVQNHEDARFILRELEAAGFVLLAKANPECNVCDFPENEGHAVGCPRKPLLADIE